MLLSNIYYQNYIKRKTRKTPTTKGDIENTITFKSLKVTLKTLFSKYNITQNALYVYVQRIFYDKNTIH